MGYYTDWVGELTLSPAPTQEQLNTIQKYCTREHNSLSTPSKYCPWSISKTYDKRYVLVVDQPKSYNCHDWLKAMVQRLFKPYSIKLNGNMEWHGEGMTDFGKLQVLDNKITIIKPSITWHKQLV